MAQLNGGSTSSDDFVLFPVNEDSSIYSAYAPHLPQYQAVSSDSMYETHSHGSEGGYTAMLDEEDSLGELHTSNSHAGKLFSVTNSSSLLSYQSQGYAPPAHEAFDLQPYPNIPRSFADFYPSSEDEEHLVVEPPHFIIHPPTFTPSYPFHTSQIGEYHSTPGASPSTTAGYEGFGSNATHSSVHSALGSSRSVNSSNQGSPYSGPDDNWSTAETSVKNGDIEPENWDGNGYINPSDLAPEGIEPVIEDSPAASPFYIPPTPRSHTDSPSPLPSRRRTPGRLSPYPTNKTQPSFPYPPPRRDSIKSTQSRKSTKSTRFSTPDETTEDMPSPSSPGQSAKDSICPECHKTFRDMKAHLLTHKEERPEKCPIPNCDYAKKGFARKYDCQRHTLTHYKGTMVCCFCPSAGSPAEKSFNRADVFKRHLMSVHHVEQTTPNSKKKPTPTSTSKAAKSPKATTPELDGTGKCSTCSMMFTNPQKFYEHLDECVLNKVVEIEPAAAYNELNLGPLRDIKKEDPALAELLKSTSPAGRRLKAMANGEIDEDDEEEDEHDVDDDDESFSGKRKQKSSKQASRQALLAAQAAQAATALHMSTKIKRGVRFRISKATPKDGKPRTRRGGKKRKNFPAAWGCSQDSMVTKRRCLMVYDGPNILWRDDMMMHDELQVRARIGADTYVSDLDVWTHQRAQDVFRAAGTVEVP